MKRLLTYLLLLPILFLPELYLTVHPSFLPVYTDLFTICH